METRRRWRLSKAPEGPMRDFLSEPFPGGGRDYRDVFGLKR